MINFNNITADLNDMQSITDTLNNTVSHPENVQIEFIYKSDDNPYASADDEKSIKELSVSIEANGLLSPITLNKIDAKKYYIISGERRFKAITQYLNWKTIPANVYDNLSDTNAQLKLHIANLAVRDYSAAQKIQFYLATKTLVEQLVSSGEYQGSISNAMKELLGVTERQLRKYKKIISELTETEQLEVIDGKISINAAYEKAVEKSKKANDENNSFEIKEKKSVVKSQKDKLSDVDAESNNIENIDSKVIPQSVLNEDVSQNNDIDNDDIDKISLLKSAILECYIAENIYKYYCLCVPTPQQAIDEFLKPDSDKSASNVDMKINYSNSFFSIFDNNTQEKFDFSYITIDKTIREMICNQEFLLNKTEILELFNQLILGEARWK